MTAPGKVKNEDSHQHEKSSHNTEQWGSQLGEVVTALVQASFDWLESICKNSAHRKFSTESLSSRCVAKKNIHGSPVAASMIKSCDSFGTLNSFGRISLIIFTTVPVAQREV